VHRVAPRHAPPVRLVPVHERVVPLEVRGVLEQRVVLAPDELPVDLLLDDGRAPDVVVVEPRLADFLRRGVGAQERVVRAGDVEVNLDYINVESGSKFCQICEERTVDDMIMQASHYALLSSVRQWTGRV
jgi:hypothetical protein